MWVLEPPSKQHFQPQKKKIILANILFLKSFITVVWNSIVLFLLDGSLLLFTGTHSCILPATSLTVGVICRLDPV